MAEDSELESDSRHQHAEPPQPPSQPPGLIQNIEWYLSHWKEHKLEILIAILIAAGVLVSKEWQPINALLFAQKAARVVDSAVDAKLLQLAKDMKDDFNHAREALESSGSTDFSEVEKEIGALLALDPENGHGLYYRGEVKRLSDQERFTPKSCVRMPLAENTSLPDAYHNDFNRYLDNVRSLAEIETAGDTARKSCYERAKGYCPQRTAWIEHLLANDFYAEGLASTNPNTRSTKFEEALGWAEKALKLYPRGRDKPFDGFDQCLATEDLKTAIIEAKARPH
jgi:tetratricopeptide (TPR) repeat protein